MAHNSDKISILDDNQERFMLSLVKIFLDEHPKKELTFDTDVQFKGRTVHLGAMLHMALKTPKRVMEPIDLKLRERVTESLREMGISVDALTRNTSQHKKFNKPKKVKELAIPEPNRPTTSRPHDKRYGVRAADLQNAKRTYIKWARVYTPQQLAKEYKRKSNRKDFENGLSKEVLKTGRSRITVDTDKMYQVFGVLIKAREIVPPEFLPSERLAGEVQHAIENRYIPKGRPRKNPHQRAI